jgi:hypothetical protein
MGGLTPARQAFRERVRLEGGRDVRQWSEQCCDRQGVMGPREAEVTCPGCALVSNQVHSTYGSILRRPSTQHQPWIFQRNWMI